MGVLSFFRDQLGVMIRTVSSSLVGSYLKGKGIWEESEETVLRL